MATGEERGVRLAEFLGVVGRIERLRATSADDMPKFGNGQSLQRWQILYSKEIDEAINRRDRAVAPRTQASVSHDELVAWIADAREILKPLSNHW